MIYKDVIVNTAIDCGQSTTGYFHISDGGRVQCGNQIKENGQWRDVDKADYSNDRGTTREVDSSQNHRNLPRRDREAESAANSLYNPIRSKESELQKELMRQIGMKVADSTPISAQFAADYEEWSKQLCEIHSVEHELFRQVAVGGISTPTAIERAF